MKVPDRQSTESPTPWTYRDDTGELLDANGNRVVCPTDPGETVHDDDLSVIILPGDGRLMAAAPDLAAENERLRALVANLPHTADGVPVVPGMRLWANYNDGRDVTGFETAEDGRLVCLHFRDGFDRCIWAHYSTRAAAEAAGGET